MRFRNKPGSASYSWLTTLLKELSEKKPKNVLKSHQSHLHFSTKRFSKLK